MERTGDPTVWNAFCFPITAPSLSIHLFPFEFDDTDDSSVFLYLFLCSAGPITFEFTLPASCNASSPVSPSCIPLSTGSAFDDFLFR
ncbi:hypothetical protein B0H14DRAFT_2703960 [Mycena olivaceomarginata]|nr:hypothetical protein B0H14DRAFT_2703960 [Mycena olivaceomarginata]